MALKGFFITGTGTDVGKSYISSLLCCALAQRGTVSYVKPVQTGCSINQDKSLSSPDFDFVKASGCIQLSRLEEHVPYSFIPACSPHLAAQMAGTTIQIDHIVKCCNQTHALADRIIVEGAGGVMVPLTHSLLTIDLIEKLKLPVIVVGTDSLGTINHTLLTIEALRSRSIRIAGLVINSITTTTEEFIAHENRQFLKQAVAPTPCVHVPFGVSLFPEFLEFTDACCR